MNVMGVGYMVDRGVGYVLRRGIRGVVGNDVRTELVIRTGMRIRRVNNVVVNESRICRDVRWNRYISNCRLNTASLLAP